MATTPLQPGVHFASFTEVGPDDTYGPASPLNHQVELADVVEIRCDEVPPCDGTTAPQWRVVVSVDRGQGLRFGGKRRFATEATARGFVEQIRPFTRCAA